MSANGKEGALRLGGIRVGEPSCLRRGNGPSLPEMIYCLSTPHVGRMCAVRDGGR